MMLLTPIAVTAANLTASNVAEDDAPAYNAGTTYAVDDEVIYAFRLYRSLVGSNTGNQPDTSPAQWQDRGAINRYKAFDALIETQTENADTIDVTIDPGAVVNAVALFRLEANSVRVVVDDPVEGVVYDETRTLQDNDLITDWYAYFFEPIETRSRVLFADLPNYRDATVQIIVDNTGGTAKAGAIALGALRGLGVTLFGTTFGILDYSRKERDAFGNFEIVERGFADRISFDVSIDTPSANRIKRLLTAARTTPVVFIGTTNREETVVYGFYRDWQVVLGNAVFSDVSIEVEGLI